MSIDVLQEKIRKLKNPSVVALNPSLSVIPSCVLNGCDQIAAFEHYIVQLLTGLKGIVPAVRFSYDWYAMFGPEGLCLLEKLLKNASNAGFYVLLDTVHSLTPTMAEEAAEIMLNMPCHSLVLSSYIGTDGLKPYVKKMQRSEKSLFVVIRTANKSATELQDLMTGSRLVHMAVADAVNRFGEGSIGKCGYAQIAGIGPASSADSIRNLRGKYKNMFLLLDGYDYPNSNAKNCSYAFDRLGHGAIACAAESILSAWKEENSDGTNFVECAVRAAERMKKNITRYTTVL